MENVQKCEVWVTTYATLFGWLGVYVVYVCMKQLFCMYRHVCLCINICRYNICVCRVTVSMYMSLICVYRVCKTKCSPSTLHDLTSRRNYWKRLSVGLLPPYTVSEV